MSITLEDCLRRERNGGVFWKRPLNAQPDIMFPKSTILKQEQPVKTPSPRKRKRDEENISLSHQMDNGSAQTRPQVCQSGLL